jgi:hypothetical protein
LSTFDSDFPCGNNAHSKSGHVIARGTVLLHIMNGRLMAAFVDDDAANRAMKGLIGLQLHSGPPMKVEFRNIWLKGL